MVQGIGQHMEGFRMGLSLAVSILNREDGFPGDT
jgi:hypothetical protein